MNGRRKSKWPPPKDPDRYAQWIKNQSESHKGHKDSLETRQKKSVASKKMWENPDHHTLVSKGLNEYWKNSDHRNEKSESSRGDKNPNFGKKQPDSTKQIIREKALERSKDPEYRKQLSESAKKKPPVSTETRKKQSVSHLGEKNPLWKPKVKKECIICGKIYEVKPSHTEGSLYCSKKCKNVGTKLRFENQEERKRASDQATERWKDPDYREHMCKVNLGRHPSESTKKKQRISKLGEKSHFWKGGRSFDPYCPKFNRQFKDNVRKRFGYKCVFPECGKTKKENRNRELSVHHLFTEKMACCESRIEEMEILRKRLPKTVAKFGEPEFTEEEIMYIRMMVPLCMSHHQKVKTEEIKELPFEDTIYRKYFAELIMREYNGKCWDSE